MDKQDHSHLHAPLLGWFARHGRELPWRTYPEPYRVWLSEIIMQQTRISQGMAYWQRFIAAFPTVERLAGAHEQQVMRLWQGLGYYSRARNLHRAAKLIAAMGAFPRTYAEILRLPGVGPYTAAAIASLCFGEDRAVVDGNVYRVLGRLYAIDTPIDTTQGQRLFRTLAADILPPGRAADWNQAMMDLGAMVCTPRSPQCGECPLSVYCATYTRGTAENYPVKRGKVKQRERRFIYLWVECGGCAALRCRPGGDIWQGLWEPYMMEATGCEPAALPAWAEGAVLLRRGVKHVLSHQVLFADAYRVEADRRPALPADFRWVPLGEVDRYGLPRLVQKLFSPATSNGRDAATHDSPPK